jgi:hypothetical protein
MINCCYYSRNHDISYGKGEINAYFNFKISRVPLSNTLSDLYLLHFYRNFAQRPIT